PPRRLSDRVGVLVGSAPRHRRSPTGRRRPAHQAFAGREAMTETQSATTTGEGTRAASAEAGTARGGSSGEAPAAAERRRLPRAGALLRHLEEPAILISLSGLFFAMLWIHLEPVEVAG